MARHSAPHTGRSGGGRHRARVRGRRLRVRPPFIALVATLLVAVVTIGPAFPLRSLRSVVAVMEGVAA